MFCIDRICGCCGIILEWPDRLLFRALGRPYPKLRAVATIGSPERPPVGLPGRHAVVDIGRCRPRFRLDLTAARARWAKEADSRWR